MTGQIESLTPRAGSGRVTAEDVALLLRTENARLVGELLVARDQLKRGGEPRR